MEEKGKSPPTESVRPPEKVPDGYECQNCGAKDFHVQGCRRPRGYKDVRK